MSKRNEKKLTDDPVLLRIMSLLKEKGVAEKDLLKAVGTNPNAFTRWKYENQKTFMIYIDKIADYFGVTLDYLIRGQNVDKNNLPVYTKKETDMIEKYRKMTKVHKSFVEEVINGLKLLEETSS